MSVGRTVSFSSRAFGFLLIPVTGILSPLIALPAVTSHYGASAWAAIAIGQSIGAAASAIGELGWGLNGPQRVARASARNSYQTMVMSLFTKLIVFVPLGLGVGLVAYGLTLEYQREAFVVAVASLAASLNVVWFFLGKSQPWIVIASDGAPRLLGVLLASLLIMGGAPLMVYAVVGLLLPCLVSPVIGLWIARRRVVGRTRGFGFGQVLRAIRAQGAAVSARAASAAYIALPITLVGFVAPAAVPVFAAGERLMRLVLGGIAAVPNAMQGWVGREPSRTGRWLRAQRAIALNACLGLVAATAFGLLGPLASAFVFSGVATIPAELAWSFAVVILIVSISRATGNLALVALSRIRVILASAATGAIVGVPLILTLAALWGALGAVVAEVVTEAVVLSVQVLGIRKYRPRGSVGQ